MVAQASRSGARPRSAAGVPAPGHEPGLDRTLALHVDDPAALEREAVAEMVAGLGGDLEAPGHARGFHAARSVHRVPPDVVDELLQADDARNRRTGMHADPDLHGH